MKPMLAARVEDMELLRFPLIATPKFDGIRAVTVGGRLLSRSLKPIPNKFICKVLKSLPDGLDGELVVGKNFQDCSSGVMSQGGEPDFTYVVFDLVPGWLRPTKPYAARIDDLRAQLRILLPQWVCIRGVTGLRLSSLQALRTYEEATLACGFEGVCLRSPDSPYKYGRSTFSEHYLLKLKRFKDGEARILGVEELLHNRNVAQTDELGHTKRTQHKLQPLVGM